MKVCTVVADRIRINTDGFPKRAPKAQDSRGCPGACSPGKIFSILTSWSPLSWVSESFRQDISQFHSPQMKPGKLADYLAFTLYTGHGWRKTKAQKPADFSLNRKQRSILFSVIWVQNKVLTDYFISQFQLMESLFFIKTYHIYHEKSDQKYDGVDPSLHSNHLDYEVERRFGWGWQDWRTLLGKPSAFRIFNFTIFVNLAHRWMWAKPHLGT